MTPYGNREGLNSIDKDIFVKKITENISKGDLITSSIVMNVPSSSIFVMIVDLPKMSKKELGVAAVSEVKRKMVPPPTSNSVFEYKIMGEKVVEDVSFVEVLVIKTESEYVNNLLSLFLTIKGKYPDIIIPNSVVIAKNLRNSLRDKFCAIVDIGYESTNISVVNKNNLYFSRDIKFGLKSLYEHFAGVVNVSIGEMEAIIQKEGVPFVDFDIRDKVRVAEEIMRQKYEDSLKGNEQKINLLELRMLWEEVLQRMSSEIRRSVSFYKQQYRGEGIENFIFFGGGSSIKGLVSEIGKSLEGECEVSDVFKGISWETGNEDMINRFGPLLAPSVYLAMSVSEVSRKEDAINFIPKKIKRRKNIIKRQFFIFLLIVGLILINCLAGYIMVRSCKKKERILKNIEAGIRKFENAVNVLNILEKDKVDFNNKVKEMDRIISKRVINSEILKQIFNCIPKEAVLLSLKMNKKIQDEDSEGLMDGGMNSEEGAGLMMNSEEGAGLMINRGTGEELFGVYQVRIETLIFNEYEKSKKIMEGFSERLRNCKQFTNTKLVLPVQEELKPRFEGGGFISLSIKKERKFIITADIRR